MAEAIDTRTRILDAASALLDDAGRDAVTTRAVSAAAGVQPPTIYRLFGDMDGLLDAVAAAGFQTYLGQKHAMELSDDPVADLRAGHEIHVRFGLEHPAHYRLMYGRADPDRVTDASRAAHGRLTMLISRIAAVGRLVVSVPTAVEMVQATGTGLTLQLIGTPPAERDLTLPGRMLESVLATITGERTEQASTSAWAASLLSELDGLDAVLSPGERALAAELLQRIADAR
ncbi:TetR/AcrR family transcriptional regulator [Agrococcus jejuensis]|uniref:DNA-binding transcriptional regulator, AcrR family n=1 Tax=Agrococcus jejuensis TaxID=399736 RepID=A0A1G8EN22_9MICO|nr:TetR/AcrR family transcriptional regulator [Agrococcus jejuensis]SDH71270.1 DNA-binding transcriptional regulator, AcrR family [Agrococcus jejuensis]